MSKPLRREGEAEGRWVLLDFVDIVVHVQHAEERIHYAHRAALEGLPVIALPREPSTRVARASRSRVTLAPGRPLAARPHRLERRARFQGQTDIPLDDIGRAQAARAAKALARLHPAPDRLATSMRARATAQALADLVGLPSPTTSDLRETYAGEWQGLTRDRARGALRRRPARSGPRATTSGPAAERRAAEVAARVAAAVDRTWRTCAPGETLVVATHGGAARAGDRRAARPADRALGGARRPGQLRVVGAGGEHARRPRWRLRSTTPARCRRPPSPTTGDRSCIVAVSRKGL